MSENFAFHSQPIVTKDEIFFEVRTIMCAAVGYTYKQKDQLCESGTITAKVVLQRELPRLIHFLHV